MITQASPELIAIPSAIHSKIAIFLSLQECARYQGICSRIYTSLESVAPLRQITREIVANQKALDELLVEHREQPNRLEARKLTWVGWLVNQLKFKTGFLGKIHQLCCFIFPFYRKELEAQRGLEQELVEFPSKRHVCTYQLEMLNEKKRNLETDLLFANLFGSEAQFEKIPTSPSNADIYRGVGALGSPFFSIKIKYLDVPHFEKISQVDSQVFSDGASLLRRTRSWEYSRTSIFVSRTTRLISDGRIPEESKESYRTLQKIIQLKDVSFEEMQKLQSFFLGITLNSHRKVIDHFEKSRGTRTLLSFY